MSEEIKGVFIKQMLLPKEELALQTMELMADKMELEKQVEQLENIRKEAIEEIQRVLDIWTNKPNEIATLDLEYLLNILNKGEKNGK